jgi:fimbrial chaperone protein
VLRRFAFFSLAAAMWIGGSLAGTASGAVASDEAEAARTAASGGASLSIAPLRTEIDSGAAGATVYLSNTSSREIAVQSRLFAWSQVNGSDTYAPTGDLILSPSISMIPPGETQIVRVLRKAGTSPGEKRFRLVVDQLPDPKSVQSGQAATRIRFTLPVFVDRDTASASSFSWRLKDDRLELANSGGATARVVTVAVKTLGGEDVTLGENTLRYVHGGSTIAWPIGRGCSLGAVTIVAQIDGQTVDAQPSSACS